MNEEVQKLLNSLKELENTVDPIFYELDEDGKCTKYIDTSKSDLTDNIVINANIALITFGGGCNLDAIKTLREHGYRVFAGEKDSFGWLTGCIQTKVGIIVYG